MSILADRVAREAPRKRPTRKQIRLAREFDIDIAKYERGFRVDIFKVLKKLGDEVGDIALEVLSDEKNLKKDAGRDAMLAGEIAKRLNVAGFETDMRVVYEKNYTRIMRATQKRINATMDLGISILDTNEARILAKGAERVKLLNLTKGNTTRSVFRELSEGRSEGEAVAQLARRISDRVKAGRFKKPQTRATLIARTETTYAQKMAAAESYRQGGVTEVMIMDSRKGSFDDDCDAMDGRIVSLQEGEALMSEEHPNGTRRMVAQPPKLDEPSLTPTAEPTKIPTPPSSTVVPRGNATAAFEPEAGESIPKWKTVTDHKGFENQMAAQMNIGRTFYGTNNVDRGFRAVSKNANNIANDLVVNIKGKSRKLYDIVKNNSLNSLGVNNTKYVGGTGYLGDFTPDIKAIRVAAGKNAGQGFNTAYANPKRPTLSIGKDAYGKTKHNTCSDLFGTSRHEYGHFVQDIAKMGGDKTLRSEVQGGLFDATRNREWKKLYDKKGRKWWRENVSIYSAKNMDEGFAECFSAWTSPLYGKTQYYGELSSAAQTLPHEIETLFKKWFE